MRALFAAIVIVAAGLAAYGNSVTGVFVFDDRPSIVDNPSAHTTNPWRHPWRAMQAPRNVTLSGRPLASLTFAVNYALAPADARTVFDPPVAGSTQPTDRFLANVWGYHAVNIAIHLVTALAIFGIVRRTLEAPRWHAAFVGSADTLALTIAAIWVVHPLTTSAVTYLVQRVESLMAMCLALTLYCAIRAWHGRRTLWGALAVLLCACGMGSKEAMVVAPIVVVVWDWSFADGSARAIVRRRWPLYAGLAAAWVVLAALVAIDARPLSTGLGFAEWPWWRYLETQAAVIVHYVRLVFAPWPLVLDYDWRAPAQFVDVALQAAAVSVGLGATAWMVRTRRPLGFAGGTFFLLLAPSSSVWPIASEIAAEHRMYLPSAVIIGATIVGAFWLIARSRGRRWALRAAVVVSMAAVAAGVSATRARNRDYVSDARIWSDTVEKQPWNARARVNYASYLLKTGQGRAAIDQLAVAVSEAPAFAEAHAQLGTALAREGRAADAIVHFERAVALNPFMTSVFEDLAQAYVDTNQRGRAVKYFLKALDQQPDDVALLNRTAWLMATSTDGLARDGAEAVRLAQHAVDLTSRRDATSLDTLAAGFAEAGRFDDAVTTGQEALHLAAARGDRRFVADLQSRLAAYRRHAAIRE